MLLFSNFPSSDTATEKKKNRRQKRWGATAVEYLFMLSLIIAVLVIVIQTVGSTNNKSLDHSAKELAKTTGD